MNLFFLWGDIDLAYIIANKKYGGARASLASGILGGTLSLTVSTVIVKLLGVLYKIPIANILGDEGMGYFNSAYTVYAFFYLLATAGVPKAVMILVSESKAREGGINGRTILRFATRTFLILGTLTTLAFIALSRPLAAAIGNDKSLHTMIAIAPSIVFVALGGVMRGYLSANLKFSSVAVSQILEGIGKLVFGLLFAMLAKVNNMPMPIVSAFTILGVTLGAIIGLLYLYISARDTVDAGQKRQSLKRLDKKELRRRIFSISVPITLSAAVMSITNVIDLGLIMRRLIENGYIELEATSLYGNYTTLAVPMFNLVISLITPVSIAFLPLLTEAVARGNKRGFSEISVSMIKLTSLLAAPLTVGMFVFSREILSLLFGNAGIDTGAPLLCMLAPALFFAVSLLLVNSSLEACGAVRAPVISMLLGSAVKVAVSYFLLGDVRFGISGAPLGTVASYAVALLVSLIIGYKRFGMRLPIFSGFLSPLVNALIAILTSRLIFDSILAAINPTLSLLIAIFISAILYFTLTLFLGGVDFGKGKEVEYSEK